MTKATYVKQLAEKINIEGRDDIDVMTMMRVLLAYNRRIAKESATEFDAKVEEKYLDTLVQANKAKVKKDDATIASLSSGLLALCDKEVKKLFASGKTFEEGLFLVHKLVVESEAIEKKQNIRQARLDADFFDKNLKMKKGYLAEKNKVEQLNFGLYDENTFGAFCANFKGMKKEDIVPKLEKAILDATVAFADEENRYVPNLVEELVRQDVQILCPANDTKLRAS